MNRGDSGSFGVRFDVGGRSSVGGRLSLFASR